MLAIQNTPRLAPAKAAPAKAAPAAPATPALAQDQFSAASALTGAARTAYDQLPSADQQAFNRTYAALSADDRDRLAQLLAKGTLTAKDSQGQSLIANLQAVATMSVPAGASYTSKAVLSQLINHLTDPQAVRQEDHNTCGPTTVQYLLLTRQPAEYARLVAGVMGGNGQVKLQGGQLLARVPDAVGGDTSNRDDINRMLQAALINQGSHLRGTYHNADDAWHAPGPFWRHPVQALSNKLAGLFGGNFGIGETSEKRLFEQALGLKAHTVGDVPLTDFLKPKFLRGGVYDQVAAAVKAGQVVTVDIVTQGLQDTPGAQQEHVLDRSKISYADAMKSHQILVTKIEGGKVFYRNPWGYETFMSQKEFQSRVTDGVIAK